MHVHIREKNQTLSPAAVSVVEEMQLIPHLAILAIGDGSELISSSSLMGFSLENYVATQRKHKDALKYHLSENKIIRRPYKSTHEITAKENLYF